MDDSKDLSTRERGAPAPQCLSELLECVKAELGFRVPGGEEPVFFKILYHECL